MPPALDGSLGQIAAEGTFGVQRCARPDVAKASVPHPSTSIHAATVVIAVLPRSWMTIGAAACGGKATLKPISSLP
jgi:hypothetical protein